MFDALFAIRDRLLKAFDLAPLFIRCGMAVGFFTPFWVKATHLDGFGMWLEHHGFPLPLFTSYLVTLVQGLGVLLLPLGLFTRLISATLLVTILVAIFGVHWQNGFNASDDGIEICVYFGLLLFSLVVYGGGRLSLDHLFFSDRTRSISD